MDVTPFLKSFQEISRHTVKLLDSLSALSALSELDHVITDEAQLLDNVLQILLHNQDVERCSIFLIEENRLVNIAGTSWSDDDVNSNPRNQSVKNKNSVISFKIGEGLIGIAASSGEIQICKNCADDARYIKKEGAVDSGEGSLICIPMIANAQVLGVLTAYHPKAEHFNYQHECFFLAFSRFIAQTLSNVRHMSTLEKRVLLRTEVLENALKETNRLKEKFEELAYVDELTGLHNRRFFFPEARAALSRAVRYDRPFTVMILDLDDFKKVNDNYGHPVGDLLLTIISNILKGIVREGDILARFGGEEFILALPHTDANSASLLADRILDAVRENELNDEIPDFSVTCSAGLACLSAQVPSDTSNLLDQMLVQADDALLECKANGKDQFHIQESKIVSIKANYLK